ncbi:ABC transporter permease [Curtobacterium sp. RRHDQ10]|uniref:ABC transporter permease n=1 Tax=Curtobacterium phyllosphaerae TaxID=3413379 RepID=UPI003BF32E4D
MTTASSTEVRHAGRAAFKQLTLLSTREVFRNVKSFISLMFSFLFFLVVIVGVDFSVNGGRPAPVVSVAGGQHSAQVVTALRDHDLVVRAADDQSVTAKITIGEHRATIALVGKHKPSWKQLVAVVHSTGIPSADILVTGSDGTPEPDVLRTNLATVLVTGFMAVAFMGTSVPLVTLRQRGTLRLLGTTPVSRTAFILAQSPVRFALGIAEAIVVLIIAWSQGYVESLSIVRLSITLIVGLAMMFALAYLVASRATNPDVIAQVTGFLPVIVIFSCGTIVPLHIFPDFVRYLTYSFPSTWFMQAVGADIAGTQPFISVYWLWAMMAAVAVAAALLAARLFKWDQGDL